MVKLGTFTPEGSLQKINPPRLASVKSNDLFPLLPVSWFQSTITLMICSACPLLLVMVMLMFAPENSRGPWLTIHTKLVGVEVGGRVAVGVKVAGIVTDGVNV